MLIEQISADKCSVVAWGWGAPAPHIKQIDGAGAPSVPEVINQLFATPPSGGWGAAIQACNVSSL